MKKKMLFVSVSPIDDWSGTGNLSAHLVSGLKNEYEITIVGWGKPGNFQDSPVLANSSNWWNFIEQVEPDIIFLSHDIWRFPVVVNVKAKYPNIKIAGYFPIDCDIISSRWRKILSVCDIVMVPSEFGRRAILERWNERKIYVIPEGVDKEFFLDSSKVVLKTEQELANTFILLFTGMNQNKKGVGVILDAFERFAKDKKDVLLLFVLHTGNENIFGEELKVEIDTTDFYHWRKVIDRIRLYEGVVSKKDLISIFQLSDLVLLPSQGEGFGLPVVESMAARSVPVIPAFSASAELPEFYFPLEFNKYKTRWNANRAIVDYSTMSVILEKAYNLWKKDQELWQMILNKNQQKARSYSWDRCVKRIKEVLKTLWIGENKTDFIEVKRLK